MSSHYAQISPSLSTTNEELTSLVLHLASELQELKAHQQQHSPYPFAQAEPPLQKFVFDATRERLYPNGVEAAKNFFKRPDPSPDAIAKVTNDISKSIRELPQNPYQSYSAPSTFEKFPPESREKKVDTALASIQTHLSHLTRPIDQLAFETMENYTDWSYRDENGNINEGLQGYESIEDLATHFDEIHGEQTMSILRRLNEYRSYLSDLSHRLTDARLNLALTALNLQAKQKPPETAPLFSVDDVKEIKDEQQKLKTLLNSVTNKHDKRKKGGRNWSGNNGNNNGNNSGNNNGNNNSANNNGNNNGANNNGSGSFFGNNNNNRGGSGRGGRGGANNSQGRNQQPRQQ